MKFDTNAFVQAYMVAALWSSTDETGDPLDAFFSIDDIDVATAQKMRSDCEDFIKCNAIDLVAYKAAMANEQWSGEARAGHDFWLTRCGHGAGFWDRGLGALGERLSTAAKGYGNVDLYAGDDGYIYT